MELNKKGFTLMELLAVIVILAIIFAVALPSISSSVERSKDKQTKAKIEVIEAAGEVYYDTYDKSEKEITLDKLVCNGLLTKDEISDPKHEEYSLCGYVEYKDNSFTWKDMSATRSNCIELDNLNC